MGDISDYYRKQELNNQFRSDRFEDEHYDEPIDTSVWKVKSGGSIPIIKMGDAHFI